MTFRPYSRTLADLRNLVRTLDQNRREYDPVSLADLMNILNRRIATLDAELQQKSGRKHSRRAA